MQEIEFSTEEKEILGKVKNLFQDPSKWTSEYYARDKFGKPVDIEFCLACSWGFVGALHYFGGSVNLCNKLNESLKQSEISDNKKDRSSNLFYINDTFGRLVVMDFIDQILEGSR